MAVSSLKTMTGLRGVLPWSGSVSSGRLCGARCRAAHQVMVREAGGLPSWTAHQGPASYAGTAPVLLSYHAGDGWGRRGGFSSFLSLSDASSYLLLMDLWVSGSASDLHAVTDRWLWGILAVAKFRGHCGMRSCIS